MAHINLKSRERIFRETSGISDAEKRILGEMLLPERFPNAKGIMSAIPGIVRREEETPKAGYIPLGFVSWRRIKGRRLRLGAFASPGEILRTASPEETAAKVDGLNAEAQDRTPALTVLRKLRSRWGIRPFSLGVWGSAAMELETGHAYTHRHSDLDVRLLPTKPALYEDLAAGLQIILDSAAEFNLNIDAELRTAQGYGVSLKELLGNGTTVLGKRQTDVTLMQKHDVFAGLKNIPPAPVSVYY
ncbi:MAG: malonate decarboxylase holo-[acyl-carrier-protein] synthase [Deltaproteobacteria bacterium]|nr:malonate decarboxylase holo-[acyl-carrier-protein] synthase [Deltaproteobacteria bacterium]